ncbi:hypothetical protein MKW94_005464 [Papaver nudicaule]|uniref:BHLH domain-containing protein n=1 Tax=Papaver nudicaule TaxID=74823 RepID=A0AA41RWV6_PAPNU|nr:hypothetical protein [Papaver nudicaule]
MYDSETHYFDPHSIQVGGVLNDPSTVATASLDFHQLEQKCENAHLVPEVIVIDDEPSPVRSGPLDYEPQHQQQEQNSHLYQEMQEQNSHYYHQQEQYYQQQPIELQHLASSSTILPNFSFDIFGETSNNNEVIQGGDNGQGSANTSYEHAMSLDLNNFHSQSPIFRELFEPPQNYGVGSSMFGGEMDEPRGVYQQQNEADNNGMRQFENLVSDFKREMNINTQAGGRTRTNGLGVAGSHGNKHTTRVEKIKREYLSGQYKALSLLVPNPSKPDRASVLASTIDYINELKGTVDYLKILVDKKRNARKRKLNIENNGNMENSSTMPASSTNIDRDQSSLNGQVRSSWSQRKSKDTEVDVRIIDTDVTIQLIIQRAKMINLLSVSRILDELQLDLLHVSSGCIGDYHSFWFNTKILEGSSLYASAIAKKLIEGVEKNYAASITESNC